MGLKAPETGTDSGMFPSLMQVSSLSPAFWLSDLHLREVIFKTDFPRLHFIGVETKQAVVLW